MRNYALFICVGLTACSVKESETSQPQIYGGTKVKAGEWMSTVALIDQEGMYCTGTALTPELVVTAAHCVQGEKLANVRVYVGDGKKNGDVDGQYKVASMAYSPKFDENDEDSDYDVGYLVLKKPLDLEAEDYVPVALNPEERAELIAAGHETHIVGFGDRENGAYGIKYEASTKITEVTKTEVSIGGKGKDSCTGDSGGPAFGRLKNGEWRVYGVVSRGDECGQGGIWGLIHASLCWIEEDSGVTIPSAEGYCQR